MVSSCNDLRDQVALCLQRSECVIVQRHTPHECITNKDLVKTLPQSCAMYMYRYLECKRRLADRSSRFRGNGPLSTGKYAEDLRRMSSGDYDPQTELSRLSKDDHVTPATEARAARMKAEATRKAQQQQIKAERKSWWPW